MKCKKSGKIQRLKIVVPCVYLIGVDLQNDFNIGNLKTMTSGRCAVVPKALWVSSLLGIEGNEGSRVDTHSFWFSVFLTWHLCWWVGLKYSNDCFHCHLAIDVSTWIFHAFHDSGLIWVYLKDMDCYLSKFHR